LYRLRSFCLIRCVIRCSLARNCCAPAHREHRRNSRCSDDVYRASISQGKSYVGKGTADPERTSIVDTRGRWQPLQPVRNDQAISLSQHVAGLRKRNRDAGRTHFLAQSETGARSTGLWSVQVSGREPCGRLLFGLHNVDRYEYT